MSDFSKLYGLVVEFDDPQKLMDAAHAAYQEGYRQMDAYTPFPVEGLHEVIGFPRNRVPLIVLIGGLVGGTLGYGFQYWVSKIDYPLNIGGRPLHSWPSFVPVTFEMTILFAALSAVLGMLALNGLPMPHHPLFNVPRFELASRTHFFLCIEATDSKFHHQKTRAWLSKLGGEVFEVES
jgi:hypothetical protein